MTKYYDSNIDLVYSDSKLISNLNKIRRQKDGLACGAVRLFKNGEIIQDISPNLVVGVGRQFVAQKLVETSHPGELEVGDDPIWDWKISHFALGNGGAATVGNYTNILGPDLCDQDIYQAIPLSDKDPLYLSTPGDPLRGINPVEYCVKPIKPTGTIDIVRNEDITCTQGPIYSYIRIVCINSPGEPQYLDNDDDYLNCNEAGLYYTNGLSGDDARVRMFAHICFPGKYIEKSSEFVIEWYILC